MPPNITKERIRLINKCWTGEYQDYLNEEKEMKRHAKQYLEYYKRFADPKNKKGTYKYSYEVTKDGRRRRINKEIIYVLVNKAGRILSDAFNKVGYTNIKDAKYAAKVNKALVARAEIRIIK